MKALAEPQVNASVLVVEDDEDLAAALVEALDMRGFEATSAHAVHQALRVAGLRAPDVWIVDYALPGMNGVDLVAWLRGSRDPALRDAILIGCSADLRSSPAFAAAGADGFIAKPASSDEVEAAVRSALSRRRVAAPVREAL